MAESQGTLPPGQGAGGGADGGDNGLQSGSGGARQKDTATLASVELGDISGSFGKGISVNVKGGANGTSLSWASDCRDKANGMDTLKTSRSSMDTFNYHHQI